MVLTDAQAGITSVSPFASRESLLSVDLSGDAAIDDQLGDFVIRHAQQLLVDIQVVLAQARRRPLHLTRRPGEPVSGRIV